MTENSVQEFTAVQQSDSLLGHGFFPEITQVPQICPTEEHGLVTYLESVGKTHLVYMANGRISILESIKHNSEQVEHLNTNGLHIHLYEPLCSYLPDDPAAPFYTIFNKGFYSEFSGDTDIHDIRCAELESVCVYARNNGLYNVCVHTCDYNVNQCHSRYTDTIKICYNDLYMRTAIFNKPRYTQEKTQILKKFISLNWRFTVSRTLTSAALCEKSAYLTYPYYIDTDLLMTSTWFNEDTLSQYLMYSDIKNKLRVLQKQVPRHVDICFDKPTVITELQAHHYPDHTQEYNKYYNPVVDNDHSLRLEELYQNSFVDIVCESRYAQPTATISEKFLQCVQFHTPFVMVGPPHTLECIKEMGFLTFDQWWDESYDFINDPLERMEAIIAVIEYIDSHTHNQLLELHKDIYPVLQHNFSIFQKVFDVRQKSSHTQKEFEPQQWLPQDNIGAGLK